MHDGAPPTVSPSRMMLRFPTVVSPARVTIIVGECCGRIGSILKTVAPSSTKTCPQAGPATTLDKSITVKPASGALVAAPGSHERCRVLRVGASAGFEGGIRLCARDPRGSTDLWRRAPAHLGEEAGCVSLRIAFPLFPALHRDARHPRAAHLVLPLGRRLVCKGGLDQIGQRRGVDEIQRGCAT